MPSKSPIRRRAAAASALATLVVGSFLAASAAAAPMPSRDPLWDRVGAVTTYRYQGNRLDEIFAFDPSVPPRWPGGLPAYEGIMRIDEGLLPGGTLVDATVDTAGPDGTWTLEKPDWLLDFTVFPFPATAGSRFAFSTDAERRIVSYAGDFLDGPPDGGIGPSGDFYFDIDYLYSNDDPGTWTIESRTPAPIPLPAAAWFLLTGLGSLIGVAARRLPLRAARA
jgi:hypothetical protein